MNLITIYPVHPVILSDFYKLLYFRNQVLSLLHLLIVCILLIWLYAGLRPRFGAGPKTALICAFIFWFTELLLIMNLVNMNIFPWKFGLVSLIFNAIELPVAVLAGASVYQETTSK